MTKNELLEVKDRTVRRIELLLDAAHIAGKEIAALAILEEALAKAVNDLKLNNHLLTA